MGTASAMSSGPHLPVDVRPNRSGRRPEGQRERSTRPPSPRSTRPSTRRSATTRPTSCSTPAQITFIDSTGITALVSGLRRLNRARRRLALACDTGWPGRPRPRGHRPRPHLRVPRDAPTAAVARPRRRPADRPLARTSSLQSARRRIGADRRHSSWRAVTDDRPFVSPGRSWMTAPFRLSDPGGAAPACARPGASCPSAAAPWSRASAGSRPRAPDVQREASRSPAARARGRGCAPAMRASWATRAHHGTPARRRSGAFWVSDSASESATVNDDLDPRGGHVGVLAARAGRPAGAHDDLRKRDRDAGCGRRSDTVSTVAAVKAAFTGAGPPHRDAYHSLHGWGLLGMRQLTGGRMRGSGRRARRCGPVPSPSCCSGGGSRYEVKLRMQNASQLVKGNLVQVAGTAVGKVKKIDLSRRRRRRHHDHDQRRLRAAAPGHARRHPPGLAVRRRQPLRRPAAGPDDRPEDPDGATLPAETTESAVDLDQLFNTFDPETRTAGAHGHQGPRRRSPRATRPRPTRRRSTSTRCCRPPRACSASSTATTTCSSASSSRPPQLVTDVGRQARGPRRPRRPLRHASPPRWPAGTPSSPSRSAACRTSCASPTRRS